jgi:general secretion pathway protein G
MLKHSSGFTLMELMVVIAVMGAVFVMAASSYMGTQAKARDARRKSDLTQISKALELFYTDHGTYAQDNSGRIAGCGVSSSSPCPWGSDFTDQDSNRYMEKIPQELQPGKAYLYCASADGLQYQLFARLENLQDPIVDQNGDGVADEFAPNCGSQRCNFAITSPNTDGAQNIGCN